MKTEIFNNYHSFLTRENKTINGVSVEFAEHYPDYIEDNETNIGCWNCRGCEECKWCEECRYCQSAFGLFNSNDD